MQPQHHTRNPGHQAAEAAARPNDEPLSDWAIVTLLGGTYIGGLAAFVATTYAISLLL